MVKKEKLDYKDFKVQQPLKLELTGSQICELLGLPKGVTVKSFCIPPGDKRNSKVVPSKDHVLRLEVDL